MKYQNHPYTYVGNVHLLVKDLHRSMTFYKEVIGFTILEQTEKKAALSADGKTVLLTIEQPEVIIEKQPRTTGLYHFALLLPTRADLGNVLLHLLQSGYPLQGASNHGVSEAIYLGDPDGNGIEIYADTPEEEWIWQDNHVQMITESMDAEGVLASRISDTWNGLPVGTVMGHIHLHVSDLVKAEEFYIKVLGFDVVLRYGAQALFISTGNYHHHIGLNTWAGVGAPAPTKNSLGLKTFTLHYPAIETLQTALANLKELGAYLTEDNGSYITQDPSGNVIRLYV
ncbi:VOC family protein [Peribacillus psychrosaccharolyticus]|uniref:VOC family protein n=1 Tax=Peribacillus psychrosaccharolyticus TaxID=1407 RepID=A0A974RYI9_PERPY|nr:VOC family protein [Peribacillus psychrosaccharolyticus]MEC2056961.1 VOC family protein [Peribacillus psychrosaccharolyticus]MED3744883.1 VOC family protein [Peribacillus psychrosaccharolyticus]QQS98493.1 VOC family protein [Peribacillus psychrosaccharolyticus]